MKLYVVRHGQTAANASGVLQGPEINGPLTEEGIKGIEETAQKLPNTIQAVYRSSLLRVVQSADILNKNIGAQVFERDELVERQYGSLSGKTWEELGELKEIDERLEYDYRPYGGESVEQVRARVEKVLEEIKNSGYEHVLVVTSRGPVRQFYHILENRIEPNVPNASLHVFDI